jgi:hypothetical protein
MVSFADYVFPDEQGSFRTNFANLVTKVERLPGQDGGYDFYGSGPAPAEIGNVGFTFYLTAETRGEMQAKRDAVLKMAAWGKQRLTMLPGDLSPARWCNARINNITLSQNFGQNTDLIQPVTVDFQVSDPFWYTQGTESNSWGASMWDGTNWGGGTGVEINHSGTSSVHVLAVGGTAHTFPRIELSVPITQSISYPVIQRIVNGKVYDEVAYNDVLNAFSNLSINCRSLEVQLNRAPAYNTRFKFISPQFFRLEPGNNTVRVNATSGVCNIKFFWYERWR